MSSDMLATACLYSSPRTSRCLPMFLNWCWPGCKKQDGCEDKKNHGNLNFTPSLKIPSSSSWMPQSTVCKVPGFCTAVALDVGKPQEPNTPLVTLQCCSEQQHSLHSGGGWTSQLYQTTVSCCQPHANPSAECWLHTAVLWHMQHHKRAQPQ